MTDAILRRNAWSRQSCRDPQLLVDREWLVTNGLGGYASSTISGVPTRRYHGLLIAANAAPLGRMMMFNHMIERLRMADGTERSLSGDPHTGSPDVAALVLDDFSLEFGLPVWRYVLDAVTLEKRILMPYRSNTVLVQYELLSGGETVRLRLYPGFHFRHHEAPVAHPPLSRAYSVRADASCYEISSPELPPLRLQLRNQAGELVLDGGRLYDVEYALERARGYEHRDVLWCPGRFETDLVVGVPVVLVASTESREQLISLDVAEALSIDLQRRKRLVEQAHGGEATPFVAELALAADQFIITPTSRVAEAAHAYAVGDEPRSVIAGYHWFTEWGRDTMISLEGLALVTGRHSEAGYILRTFAHSIRDGLIPNLFPEGEQEGLYHTADATLWFFHALDRYLNVTGDRATLQMLLPGLCDIIEHHLAGTRFGIGVDSNDGLLRQGQQGYQLTWMDAKVGDWVVTPRRGKAVEINALWYNALRLLASWLQQEGDAARARRYLEDSARAYRSFNERFWYEKGRYLYDVIDGEGPDDPAMRPNQIFALSLPHPVLETDRWPAVLSAVTEHLLTPLGLRSLAPGEGDYKAQYDGDLRSRDAAYHQGTVWGWLIGPFVDAYLKVHPERKAEARAFIDGFYDHLGEAGIGTLSEVFDAEAPYMARGCIAQAWSVAEVLRVLVRYS